MSKKRKTSGARDAPKAGRSVLINTSAGIVDAATYLRSLSSGYTPLSRCPEVRMCVHIYADLISDMTIHLMRNSPQGDVRVIDGLSRVLDVEPNAYMTRKQLIYAVVSALMLGGDGNAVIVPKVEDGYLRELMPIPPSAVSYNADNDAGYTITISGRKYRPDEVIHIAADPSPERPWLGTSVRMYLRDAVACLAQASATKSSVMSSPTPSIIVKVDGLTDEYASPDGQKKLSERFEEAKQAGQPWYIPAEAFDIEQVKPLTMNDLAIKDNIELDKRAVAALFGVPPFMVGVGSFNKDEYNNFVTSRLMGKAKYIEQALTKGLLYSDQMYIKFNPRSLYNYQLSELVTAGGALVDRMAMRRNELRDWVGLTPDEDMQELLALENYVPANRLGDQAKLNGGEE